jgi:hypothetical protein
MMMPAGGIYFLGCELENISPTIPDWRRTDPAFNWGSGWQNSGLHFEAM